MTADGIITIIIIFFIFPPSVRRRRGKIYNIIISVPDISFSTLDSRSDDNKSRLHTVCLECVNVLSLKWRVCCTLWTSLRRHVSRLESIGTGSHPSYRFYSSWCEKHKYYDNSHYEGMEWGEKVSWTQSPPQKWNPGCVPDNNVIHGRR